MANSYGSLLATTQQGRYYWSDVLGDIHFVPKRCRKATWRSFLPRNQNTRERALKEVLLREGIRLA